MGCCCSKKGIEENEEKERAMKRQRWEPPPPPPEEEKVKEVLSETPKAKPKAAPSSPVLIKPVEKEANKDHEQLEKKPIKPKLVKSAEISPPPADDRSEQPQPSDDGCSLSEVSNATSAATTTKEEMISVNSTTSSGIPPRMPRSNYNRRSYSGELFAGSNSRRERSSPAVVTGLGCRSGRTSPGPQPRNHRSVNGVKRDVGERSGRRSLSPGAKRRDVTGAGMHGERYGGNRGVPLRKVPALPTNKMLPATTQLPYGGGAENPGNEGKESLENPSVSLECFIFL